MQNTKMAALAALVAALSLGGCLKDKNESDDDPPAASGSDVLAYESGHPLATETTEAWVLDVETRIHDMANQYRVGRGLNALVELHDVSTVARGHSRHMAGHGFFAHDNPEGDGPGGRLAYYGIPYLGVGENIAAGQGSPEEAFQAWLDSPAHLANLEGASWTHSGVGHWTGGPYGRYYTHLLMRRR